MINVVLFLILLFLCVGFYTVQRKLPLQTAEAGAITGVNKQNCASKRFSYRHDFVINGKPINPSKHIMLVVEGNCMSQRKIENGDIIFVRKFDKSFTKNQIKPDDILLIWHDSEQYKGYKIRVLDNDKSENNNELNTFYYKEDGNKHLSCHNINNIKGVVKYKLQKK
ncbi:MAG: S24 family peptidase [Prevotellaceae bacterium]|jgi:hypothetical protein|nr:S24 family peptidase [Prevotellaceae bacterium]